MTTPTKREIESEAIRRFMGKQVKTMNCDIMPQVEELKESGIIDEARLELMGSKVGSKRLYQEYCEAESFNETEKEVETEIPFSVSDALASGFYVCGTRQLSGKTNLVKILVSKLLGYGVTVYVIDPSLAWLNNSPINNFIRIPKGKGCFTMEMRSTIFDVSRLGYAERFALVKNFCKVLTETHLDGYDVPEMVIFEEAHSYVPNGCMRSRKYSDIVDFCTIGGNYGLSFGAVTQFSASVDKAIVKLAQQRYFGLTTENNDKRYVKSFTGKQWLNDLIQLQLGQFLYQNKATIQKFQCEKYGTVKNFGNRGSYNYKMQFPLVVS